MLPQRSLLYMAFQQPVSAGSIKACPGLCGQQPGKRRQWHLLHSGSSSLPISRGCWLLPCRVHSCFYTAVPPLRSHWLQEAREGPFLVDKCKSTFVFLSTSFRQQQHRRLPWKCFHLEWNSHKSLFLWNHHRICSLAGFSFFAIHILALLPSDSCK